MLDGRYSRVPGRTKGESSVAALGRRPLPRDELHLSGAEQRLPRHVRLESKSTRRCLHVPGANQVAHGLLQGCRHVREGAVLRALDCRHERRAVVHLPRAQPVGPALREVRRHRAQHAVAARLRDGQQLRAPLRVRDLRHVVALLAQVAEERGVRHRRRVHQVVVLEAALRLQRHCHARRRHPVHRAHVDALVLGDGRAAAQLHAALHQANQEVVGRPRTVVRVTRDERRPHAHRRDAPLLRRVHHHLVRHPLALRVAAREPLARHETDVLHDALVLLVLRLVHVRRRDERKRLQAALAAQLQHLERAVHVRRLQLLVRVQPVHHRAAVHHQVDTVDQLRPALLRQPQTRTGKVARARNHARVVLVPPPQRRLQHPHDALLRRTRRLVVALRPHQAVHGAVCPPQQVRHHEGGQEPGRARHEDAARLRRRVLRALRAADARRQLRLEREVARRNGVRALRRRRERHAGQRRAGEQRVERQLHAEVLVDLHGHLRREHAVAAQVEEVVLAAPHDAGEVALPDGQHALLRGRELEHDVAVVLLRRVGQRVRVDLGVGCQRHLLQHDDRRGHHVVRHLRLQELAVRGRQLAGRLGGDVRLLERAGDGDHVADDDLLALAVLAHDRHVLLRQLVAGELRVDLAQLDAEAADLHLVVHAAQALDGAVHQVVPQVARPVQLVLRVRRERRLDELLRRLLRQPQVPLREVRAAHVDLGRLTHAGRLAGRVQQQHLAVLHALAAGDHLLQLRQELLRAALRRRRHVEVADGPAGLGGAPHVNDAAVGREAAQAQHVALDQHVADEHDEAEVLHGEALLVHRHEDLAERRREAAHRHALVAHVAAQAPRRVDRVLRRDVHRSAEEQRREDVALQRVVGDAGAHAEAVARCDVEGGAEPRVEGRQRRLAAHDTLRDAGGARGEGDDGGVVRLDVDVRHRGGEGRVALVEGVRLRLLEHHTHLRLDALDVRVDLRTLHRRLGDAHPSDDARNLHAGHHTLTRVLRVHHRVRGTGLVDTDDGHHHGRAAVPVDSDHVALLDAALDQRVGEAARRLVELVVRQLQARLVRHRKLVGALLGVLGEDVHERTRPALVLRRGGVGQHAAHRRRDQRVVVDAEQRLLHSLAQQHDVVVHQLRYEGAREQLRVVQEDEVDAAVPRLDHTQRQVVRRERVADDAGLLDARPADAAAQRRAQLGVHHVHDLEQRREGVRVLVLHAATEKCRLAAVQRLLHQRRVDDLLEVDVLVAHHAVQPLRHTLRHLPEGGCLVVAVRRQVHAQRDPVRVRAHGRVEALRPQVRQQTQHDVLLRGHPAQPRHEGGAQDVVDAELAPDGEAAQVLRHRGRAVQRVRDARLLHRHALRTRAVRRHLHDRHRVGEVAGPVADGLLEPVGLGRVELLREVAAVAQLADQAQKHGALRRQQLLVRLNELAHHPLNRPRVGDAAVRHDKHLLHVAAPAHDDEADERLVLAADGEGLQQPLRARTGEVRAVVADGRKVQEGLYQLRVPLGAHKAVLLAEGRREHLAHRRAGLDGRPGLQGALEDGAALQHRGHGSLEGREVDAVALTELDAAA
eukprot:Rhum_TRINITY_DN14637_c17_g1::Rhum_TRINITY_DN14637_c17_g1_i1::g.102701::m.102701